jgi:cytidylate kinase
MAIITISRGSYSKGKEIAERVAEKLGYECVSRDILLEASEHFHIPEIKLVRALHDAPSILERFSFGKERYVAFTEEAFLEHMQRDNIVYHGLAGHFFLKGVGHNLKVRIVADIEDRIKLEMEREGITEDKARSILKKDDYERRRWSMALHGIDTADPSLYDIYIHIHKITVEDAVDIICHTAKLPHFATTEDSQKIMDDLVLASKVKVAIIDEWPRVNVKAYEGKIYVHTEAPLEQEVLVRDNIVKVAKTVSGVEEVSVSVTPSGFASKA